MNGRHHDSLDDFVICGAFATPLKKGTGLNGKPVDDTVRISQLRAPEAKIMAGEMVAIGRAENNKPGAKGMWNISQMQRDFFESEDEIGADPRISRPERAFKTPNRKGRISKRSNGLDLSAFRVDLSSKAELKTKDPHEMEVLRLEDSGRREKYEVGQTQTLLTPGLRQGHVILPFETSFPKTNPVFSSELGSVLRMPIEEQIQPFKSSEKKQFKNEYFSPHFEPGRKVPCEEISDFKLGGIWGAAAQPNYSQEPLRLDIKKSYAFESFMRSDSGRKNDPDSINQRLIRWKTRQGFTENPNVVITPAQELHLNLVDLNLDEVDALSFDFNARNDSQIKNPNDISGMALTNFMTPIMVNQALRNYSQSGHKDSIGSRYDAHMKLSDLKVSDFFEDSRAEDVRGQVCYSCRYKVKWANRRKNLCGRKSKLSNRLKFEKLNPRLKSRRKRNLRVICTCHNKLGPAKVRFEDLKDQRLMNSGALFNFSDLKLDILDIKGIDLDQSESELSPGLTDDKSLAHFG